MDWKAYGVEASKGPEREAHVLVIAEASEDEVRAPVMVNLVLDRSGSMKGAPLAAAVEAAPQFVELARPDDFLGLVLFDGVPEQRVPVCAMDARGKKLMSDALQGISTGRGTALHQAVELAAKGLQRTLVPGPQAAAAAADRRRALGGPGLAGHLRRAGRAAVPRQHLGARARPRAALRRGDPRGADRSPRATPSSTSTGRRGCPRRWAR